MAFTVAVKVENGRALNFGEDWGPVYDYDDVLPCCGCTLASSATLETSECGCRCHQTPRAWRGYPQVA